MKAIYPFFLVALLFATAESTAVSAEETATSKAQAYLAEDARRVFLLRSYDGTTTAERVCAEWTYATDGQLGFLGFSKQAGQFSIHMGRDIDTLLKKKKYGMTSIRAFRESMFGSCVDNIALSHDTVLTDDSKIQCALRFEAGLLVKNECKEIALFPLEYYALIQ
jgi:hypothetical protein